MITELKSLSTIYQERCAKIFSGEIAERYPMKADGERYEMYRKLITLGCFEKKSPFVLELCCGTAKYAHMLAKTSCALYVGVDLSADMLLKAERNCVRYFRNYCLINDTIENYKSEIRYDFIFSIGTLGEYVPLSASLLNKMVSFLNIGGKMFFTVVDRAAYTPKPDLTYDWSSLYMTKGELERMLTEVKIKFNYSIVSHTDNKHTHLICKIQRR